MCADADRAVVHGIHYEVAGSGPPVVLSHDGLLHGESWDSQFGVLAAGYRVARWDRRGYGRSSRPAERFSSAEDLAAVVRAVSEDPATLVGSSFGAFFSMLCTLDHPELVAALVLSGPAVTGLPLTEHFLTRGGRRPPPDTPDADQIAYWSRTDPWFVAPASIAARERLRELLTASPQNLRPPMDLERPPEAILPRLGAIAVPTLIVVGEHDIADVHAHAGAVEAAIPGARRVVIPGAGHVPYLEVPGAFNRVVLEFLAEVRARDTAT